MKIKTAFSKNFSLIRSRDSLSFIGTRAERRDARWGVKNEDFFFYRSVFNDALLFFVLVLRPSTNKSGR